MQIDAKNFSACGGAAVAVCWIGSGCPKHTIIIFLGLRQMSQMNECTIY